MIKTKGFLALSAIGISGDIYWHLCSYLVLHFIERGSIPEWSGRFVFLFHHRIGFEFGLGTNPRKH